jgi:hypothetical protein
MNVWRVRALAVSTAVLLSACGGGSGSDSGTPPPPPPPDTSATVSGSVFAAATSGATVTMFAADAHGQASGNALGTATTDAGGNYSLRLAAAPPGPVLLVSSGGSYASEADNSNQPGVAFSALVPSVPTGSSSAQLNPLTAAIAAHASNLLSGSQTAVPGAVTAATAAVQKLFGLDGMGGNPQNVAPSPAATSGDAWLLSALAGTIEQLRVATGLAPAVLYKALSDDISDGKLDGLKAGQAIALGSAGQTLQSSLFTSQLSGAANAYGGSHATYQGATAKISAALQVSAQAVGVAIGSSGAIAPLQTQAAGTQIYFAARQDGLVMLDMHDPANPVASRMAAINKAVMTGSAGSPGGVFDSIDGIVINPTPITVGGASKVYGILYSYASKTIVAVNLTDGVVAGQAELAVTKSAEFSGANAYVAGGIADGQRGLIWLATGEGLLGVDPSGLAKAPIRIAQPAGTSINENIGGDPAAGIVFSPDYDGKGMVVFNLAEAKAYVMSAAEWVALTGTTGFGSVGELDGAALDSQYKVALLTPEGSSKIGLLGYNTPAGATGATGTFSSTVFTSVDSPAGFAGAAIDPVSHTALFVGEGAGVGVGVIDNPANPNWKGFSAFVADNNASYRFEPHDPHTLGAFNITGKPFGFLLQGSGPYQVVVLDLNAMLATPAKDGQALSDVMHNPAITKLIGY